MLSWTDQEMRTDVNAYIGSFRTTITMDYCEGTHHWAWRPTKQKVATNKQGEKYCATCWQRFREDPLNQTTGKKKRR